MFLNGQRKLKGAKENWKSKVEIDFYVLLGSTSVIGRTCTFDHTIWANVQAYIRPSSFFKCNFCHFVSSSLVFSLGF